MAHLHQGFETETDLSPHHQVLHSKDSLQKGLDGIHHMEHLHRKRTASLRCDRTENTARAESSSQASSQCTDLQMTKPFMVDDFQSVWPMGPTDEARYMINGTEYWQPSASYLENITPVRVERKTIYAPMRVITANLKGIKDLPNGTLSIICFALSGETVATFDCKWDCMFGSIRRALGEQSELEDSRVRLISVKGVELLDNMCVKGLLPGTCIEEDSADQDQDDDVEDALIRSRMEHKLAL